MKRLALLAAASVILFSQSLLARDMGMRSGQAAVASGSDWSYAGETGPASWSELADEYSLCGSGTRQSPIDLRGSVHQSLPRLHFHYHTSVLSIEREPAALRVSYDSGSYLKIRGKRYTLTGFEFHMPGEHGFQGKISDMEIHLHHLDPQGQPLIVAIPVVGSHRKSVILSRILDNMPYAGVHRQFRRIGMNAMFLLPTDRSYLLYQGSQTRPPCRENVTWVVFSNPLRVSTEDLERFGAIIHHNARPLQPVNNRVILRDSR